MALNYPLLADQVASAIGQSFTSTQVLGWAHAIVDELTISGHATFNNFASPHPISGMSGSSLASRIVSYAGYPYVSTQLLNYATAIVNHIQSNSIVTYTAPVPSPPAIPPSAAWFLNGTISGTNGTAMASAVASAVGYPGVSPQLLAKCIAIANHINANAQVTSGVIS